MVAGIDEKIISPLSDKLSYGKSFDHICIEDSKQLSSVQEPKIT